MYIGLFKENGERYTSIVFGIHFNNEEEKQNAIERCRREAVDGGYNGDLLAVELSNEEQELYQTNEYVRNIENGKPTLRPPYVPSIDELAESTWATAKTARDAAEQAGCPYLGKVLDSDSISVQRINTAVQAAQVATAQKQEFAVDWTMQDNSVLTMSIQDVLGMPVALAAYSNQLHEKARQCRENIDRIVSDYKAGTISEAEARSALATVRFVA